MKTYRGWRLYAATQQYDGAIESERHAGSGVRVVVTDGDDAEYPLPLYTHVRNHSPAGFNMGYGGSGPAQLALAICCDCLGEKVGSDPHVYQRFKAAFVARWDDEWSIDEIDINNWLAGVLQEQSVKQLNEEGNDRA